MYDEGGTFAAVVDQDFVLRAASARAQGVTGWVLDEVVGGSAAELIHPADLERALQAFGEIRRFDGVRPPDVYRIIDSAGRHLAFDVSGRNLDDPPGTVVFQLRELSDRRRAEMLAVEQIELIEQLSSGAAMSECLTALTNLAERHIDNSIALLVVGDTIAHTADCPGEFVVRHREERHGPLANANEAFDRGLSFVETDLADLDHWSSVTQALRIEGIHSVVTTPIVAAAGESIGHVEVLRRSLMSPTNGEFSVHELVARLASLVVERHRQNERLMQVVHEDPLTGLGNRRYLDRRLGQIAAKGKSYAIGVIDLDQFSWINNNLGHQQGDSVLSTVAERLAAIVGPDIDVTRFGGDEFVIVVTGDPKPAELVELGRRILSALDETIELASGPRRVTAAVGFSIAHVSDENPHEVLVRADAAMYAANATAVTGSGCTTMTSDAPSGDAWCWPTSCRPPSPRATCPSPTSPSSTSIVTPSSAWRPWSAGGTRPTGWSGRTSSSPSPSTRARSSTWTAGCWARPIASSANGSGPDHPTARSPCG